MFKSFYRAALRVAGVSMMVLAWSALAQARADGTDRSVTLEKAIQRFVVQPDGSFRQDVETVSRIDEERGIQAVAQRPLSYNRSLETLEVIEAFTQKPDGRKIKVDAAHIKEQQEPASSRAPMFQDSVNKVVIFPEVAVGDRLVLHYQRKRFAALFPDNFEDLTVPGFYPIEHFALTYDMPVGMSLHAQSQGFKASQERGADGRVRYRWDYVPAPRPRIETSAVSYMDYGQYLAVSTFADFGQFAQAYQARAEAQVSPAIGALARQLTEHAASPREKALALSDWVRKNVRYVAVYVGAGGVVPHSPQTVLDNRYGDCKDHVALLGALLQAAGIESTPALMNLGNAYAFPKVPTLGVLNHVITYVPSLDLYLDSTDPSIASGYLPPAALDKQVLLTVTGTFGHTPVNQPGKAVGELVFKVADNGAADLRNVSTVEGWASAFNEHAVKSMKTPDRQVLVQKVLAAYGQRGAGRFRTRMLDSGAFETVIEGHTENLVNLPGPVGVVALSSLAGGIAQNVYGFAAEKERTQGFVCISGETHERSRYEFPSAVNVLAVPKAVSIEQDDIRYSASYARDGNAVVIERRFHFDHPSAVCTPEQFKVMKPAIEAMVKDLQSQIIVQAS